MRSLHELSHQANINSERSHMVVASAMFICDLSMVLLYFTKFSSGTKDRAKLLIRPGLKNTRWTETTSPCDCRSCAFCGSSAVPFAPHGALICLDFSARSLSQAGYFERVCCGFWLPPVSAVFCSCSSSVVASPLHLNSVSLFANLDCRCFLAFARPNLHSLPKTDFCHPHLPWYENEKAPTPP